MAIKRWALNTLFMTVGLGAALVNVGTSPARGQSREELREQFQQTYPLQPGGRVSLENINGTVRVAAWDRNEVRVEAVKRAYTAERMQEAEIKIDADPSAVRIRTRYPHSSMNWHSDEPKRYHNPASVDYTLTVPRGARLDEIKLINSPLDLSDLTGEVNASVINGKVTARGLAGRTRLSVINGRLEAAFTQLDESRTVELSSVNGPVALTIPSDANAEIRAGTVHGSITNDLGLPVRRGRYVGRDLAGQL
ncbi:MAG: hypothetical protein ACRD68_03970, partial [Pyrinomonadaceae bacterium]